MNSPSEFRTVSEDKDHDDIITCLLLYISAEVGTQAHAALCWLEAKPCLLERTAVKRSKEAGAPVELECYQSSDATIRLTQISHRMT